MQRETGGGKSFLKKNRHYACFGTQKRTIAARPFVSLEMITKTAFQMVFDGKMMRVIVIDVYLTAKNKI